MSLTNCFYYLFFLILTFLLFSHFLYLMVKIQSFFSQLSILAIRTIASCNLISILQMTNQWPKKKTTLFYNGVHYTTKAWENAYVVGSRHYTWSGCEQRKRKRWLKDLILGLCQRRNCIGKEVRYAPDMVLKHSQKGRYWLSKVSNYEDTPYWLNVYWITLETRVSFIVLLMSLSLSRVCFPSSGKSPTHGPQCHVGAFSLL